MSSKFSKTKCMKCEPTTTNSLPYGTNQKNFLKLERSLPSALQDYVVESPMLERSGGDEDMVKFEIVFLILDKMNAELERRFSEFSCNILRGIQSLTPAGDSFLQLSHMKSLAEAYDANMDDLVHESLRRSVLSSGRLRKG